MVGISCVNINNIYIYPYIYVCVCVCVWSVNEIYDVKRYWDVEGPIMDDALGVDGASCPGKGLYHVRIAFWNHMLRCIMVHYKWIIVRQSEWDTLDKYMQTARNFDFVLSDYTARN